MTEDFLTREVVAAHQLAQLRGLLGAILPGNAFYRNKYAGLDTEVGSLEDFAARFPFTTKQELVEDQLRQPPFGSNLTYPAGRYTRFHQTSGMTRWPLRWLDTPESWAWMVKSWMDIYRAAGVAARDRVYFAFTFGPFIGFWLAFEAAQQLGCLCIPGGGLSTQGRLRAILENGATVLCCTPSYAARLAETAALDKFDLKAGAVRVIIVAGEPGGSVPATRGRLEKLWPGARIFDHHGMTETGPVSHECPSRPGTLHVLERAYLAEIIGPEGRAAKEGETGELVLTTLGRTGSPLLRYRTGDLARAGGPCPCGRPERALPGGLLGRTDEMVIIRGVNIYPTAVEEVLRGFPEIAEYQVEVSRCRSLLELSVRIEALDGGAEAATLAGRVQEALHGVFNLRVPVALAPAGSLPRFEMKARRWKFPIDVAGRPG
jgi:phenylacetate-CoA ligase